MRLLWKMSCWEAVTELLKRLPMVMVYGALVTAMGGLSLSFFPHVVETTLGRLCLSLLLYTPLIMVGLCYYLAWTTFPGRPSARYRFPLGWEPPPEGSPERGPALESLVRERGLRLTEREKSGEPRVCDRCCLIKPDRTHHCGICDACILRFDHHCVAINNCVGYGNYKYFLLTLFWVPVEGIIGLPIAAYYILWLGKISELKMFDYVSLLALTYAALYCLGMGAFGAYLFYNLARNRTTLEGFLNRNIPDVYRPNDYNLGWRRNIEQVLGRDVTRMMVPVFTEETNGEEFPRWEEDPILV